MKTLSIGQVAKQAGVTVEAIRFYEKEGLIPKPTRNHAGYRVYDASLVQRIEFIQRAKQLGFALREITELLNLRRTRHTSCADIQQVALNKIAEIDKRLLDLQHIRRALQTLAERCDGLSEVSKCPILDALDESHSGVINP